MQIFNVCKAVFVAKDYHFFIYEPQLLAELICMQNTFVGAREFNHVLQQWRVNKHLDESPKLVEHHIKLANRLAKQGWFAWLPGNDSVPVYPVRFVRVLGTETPSLFWCLGNFSLLEEPAVAIVGTRLPDKYGLTATHKYSTALSDKRVIISGNALGIDSAAHYATLSTVNGRTIFFLPCAPESFSPHFRYKKEDDRRWLALTPFTPGKRLTPWHFIKRNELLAAHAQSAIIAQTGLKGGTINTLHHLNALKRNVFVINLPSHSKQGESHQRLLSAGIYRPIPCQPNEKVVQSICSFTDDKPNENAQKDAQLSLFNQER